MSLLAVDIGGTKAAFALVTRQGVVSARERQPTDPAGPESLLDAAADFARRHGPIEAVGVCVPAVLAHGTDRLIWAPNLPGWRDVPLRELLQARVHRPAFIEYDGHAAVLGEWWAGAARGCRHVASIIVGTGIGGGFIVDNRLWQGRDRLAGAVGWFPVMGPAGVDHWENLASGVAIARRASQLLAAGRPSSLPVSGELDARAVFDAARAGDALARQVVSEAAELIGQGVACVISLVNPEIVVLGGSVGQQADLLLETVRASAARWAQPMSAAGLVIVSTTLGEEANLLGTAYSAYARLDGVV